MHLANYTSENICRALGLGGFANDWQLAEAEECIRVLLTPSFHREVCISVLRQGGKVSLSVVLNQNVGCDESYQSFVAEAIRLSHRAIANPRIRNALADSGTYAGLRLPIEAEPPAKEFVRTLVLGGKEETAQLLEALRKQHE